MADEVDTPPRNGLYETNFYAWTREQARLLREGRWQDLGLDNLIDEVEGVGSSERREIRNRLVVLLTHLLKWTYQPGRRGGSWRRTIGEQRSMVSDVLADSPSLRDDPASLLAKCYLSARLKAADETSIDFTLFPETCPFTVEQALDRFHAAQARPLRPGRRDAVIRIA